MISALFWDITRRGVVIVYRRFGTTCRSHLQGSIIRLKESDSWTVKMGPTRCPETSVNNYHTTPRNTPEERRPNTLFFSKAVWPTKHSIQWVPAFFPGGKATECEFVHRNPFDAAVRNRWSYTSTPLVCLPFWADQGRWQNREYVAFRLCFRHTSLRHSKYTTFILCL
jgi:hypothetical protein